MDEAVKTTHEAATKFFIWWICNQELDNMKEPKLELFLRE